MLLDTKHQELGHVVVWPSFSSHKGRGFKHCQFKSLKHFNINNQNFWWLRVKPICTTCMVHCLIWHPFCFMPKNLWCPCQFIRFVNTTIYSITNYYFLNTIPLLEWYQRPQISVQKSNQYQPSTCRGILFTKASSSTMDEFS